MDKPLIDVPATSAAPTQKPLCGGKRFRELPLRGQYWITARCVDDLVAPDDPVRAYDAIIDELDVSALESTYRGGGAPAYRPRDVLKLVIFAMTTGVRSAREIARRCRTDVRFMWLAHGVGFDHELFSDFRLRFGDEFKHLFKQTVRLGIEAGLITLGQVSIDGSKIAAHARRKSLSAADLDKVLETLDQRIEELLAQAAALDAAEDIDQDEEAAERIPAELADVRRRRERLQEAKAKLQETGWDRVSETDPEAPVQKTQDGKRPGYNGQIAVDDASGMVVGQDLTDAQNDTQQLAPMLDEVLENTGFKPDVAAADTGYQSAEGLEYLQAAGINGYVKQQRVGNAGRFGHEDFRYDADRDLYLCPGGHELTWKGFKDLRYDRCRLYRASTKCCGDCPQRAQCLSAKATFRQLVIAPHGELVTQMRRKLETEEGERALKRRFATVEPAFGVLKTILGLRQFLLVGHKKAATELTLATLAINVRKLTKWATEGGSLRQVRQAPAAA